MASQQKNRRRATLPPDRVYFSDLPELLGESTSSIRRQYRPSGEEVAREHLARILDLRERRDGVLHCDRAKVEALRAAKWNPLDDPLATGASKRADKLPRPPED